jgi:hypothetical protein
MSAKVMMHIDFDVTMNNTIPLDLMSQWTPSSIQTPTLKGGP